MLSREERAELLAEADAEALIALADACLADGAPFQVLSPPEVGSVAAQVADPVAADRFLLGDILACRAEVELDGHRGWAMRLGDERAAVLAAAVLDAEALAGRAQAAAVDELCDRVRERRLRAEEREWAELAPTVVEFEELT
ncbi:phosphonate C-P lyase system protein PhnG [Nocardia puris]|uniref:Alpha-D-ribose 1-methylphosphonate 5-triphosphate synthase subunit PhnG n=1 Tax=Nocardia puris TaxID=208602 RepID=A0A366DJX7_9NOCA|nr:phosphonate C-P lyase system protein PhnG [Nocardia puris]MBF6213135.1 phosphonate C-P lyase system protein PhnG [Nocardia puris]MBF6370064.1 phosphonate C-P lyase system protein PhnG [Nocardia puris]MBF6462760.1 phosphonate C-P lyase system protein PhnG [Nocardia puris]RBO90382.1 alpha-D-ribose 1-methylphosphonate 5-triphosphate synthase subunit PhnG [Nocardia puris]